MPYIQSQHIRDSERLIYGWAAPSPMRMEAASLAADPLTGFATLKEFYRIGPTLVEQCLASGAPCAMAIIDIDHFRRLNDTHGEETVSRALKAVAMRLKSLCKENQHLIARLDDEEFGILVVGLDGEAATEFCEQVRVDLAAMRIDAGDAQFSITVSIGLAEVCGPETFDNYLNAAEQFLFMAKSYGRNQIFSDHTVALQVAN